MYCAATTSRQFVTTVLAVYLVTFIALCSSSYAQEPRNTIEKQWMIDEIKRELLRELREGGLLQQEVELGIQRFLERQREAEQAARAHQEALESERAKNVRRVSPSRDHIFGNLKAPVSLIVYADYECQYCKAFHPTSKSIVKEYNGVVNLVYRHFPLSFHNPGAQKQAEASECVAELGGNSAFWNFTDAIYARTQSNGNGFPLSSLAPLAKEIGIDPEIFQRCLDAGRYAARVEEDLVEGGQIGITGTPGNVLLHNETGEAVLKSGALPLEMFKPEIDRMLK